MNGDFLQNQEVKIEDIIEREALIYITGYVAYRFRFQYSFLGDYTKNVQFSPHKPDWVLTLSDGHLIYPSDHFLEAAFLMNKIFEQFHGTSTLSTSMWIFKTVTKLTMKKMPEEYNIPEEVMLCLVRTRTYIRLREINKKCVSDVKNNVTTKKFQNLCIETYNIILACYIYCLYTVQ